MAHTSVCVVYANSGCRLSRYFQFPIINAIPNQRNSKVQLGLMVLMSMSVISLSISGHMPRSKTLSKMHKFYFVCIALDVTSCVMASVTMLMINLKPKWFDLVNLIRVMSFALHIFILLSVLAWFLS